MADPTPCPACGTESSGAAFCPMCGQDMGGTNAGTGRCARCGADMPAEHDFCPQCGLDQRRRHARPHTGALRLHGDRRNGDRPGPRPDPARSQPDPGEPLLLSQRPAVAAGGAQPLEGPVSLEAPLPAPVRPSSRVGGKLASDRPLPRPRAGLAQVRAIAHLVVLERDGSEGDRFPITRDEVEIGRGQVTLRFPDDRFLSPRHARLERNGEGFDLIDLGSLNGVYLQINRPEPVYPGDMFQIGHHLLRLENLDGSEDKQPPDGEGTLRFGTPFEPAWARLLVMGQRGMAGDLYHLRGQEVVFGRESGDIVFPDDPFLSRRHARLRSKIGSGGMTVLLEDLGSANGTYLRLRQRARVGSDDTFRVGDQILRIRMA